MTTITSVMSVPFREIPTSMLPSSEAQHTCRRPIHPPSGNRYSRKFALTEF
jgi:hypothetical protein